MNIPASE